MPSEPNPFNTREVFLRRLGWYAVGLALGFMMLGAFYKARRGAAQKRPQGQSITEPVPQPAAQPAAPGPRPPAP